MTTPDSGGAAAGSADCSSLLTVLHPVFIACKALRWHVYVWHSMCHGTPWGHVLRRSLTVLAPVSTGLVMAMHKCTECACA